MKTQTPLLVTILLVGIGFVLLARQENAPESGKPADVINAMFDAAKSGRLRKYFNCFTPGLRADLERRRREQGTRAFRRYLQERQQPVNGFVLSDLRTSGDTATVTVEWVYNDHNEKQSVRLKKIAGKWRIDSFSEARRQEQAIPYGAPAYPLTTPERQPP